MKLTKARNSRKEWSFFLRDFFTELLEYVLFLQIDSAGCFCEHNKKWKIKHLRILIALRDDKKA